MKTTIPTNNQQVLTTRNELLSITTRRPNESLYIDVPRNSFYGSVNYKGEPIGAQQTQYVTLLCVYCKRPIGPDNRRITVSSTMAYCYPCYQTRRFAFLVHYVLLAGQLFVCGVDYEMVLNHIALPFFLLSVRTELFVDVITWAPISPELLFMTPHVPHCELLYNHLKDPWNNWIYAINLNNDFMDLCRIWVEPVDASPIKYHIVCEYICGGRYGRGHGTTKRQADCLTLSEVFLALNASVKRQLFDEGYQWDQA